MDCWYEVFIGYFYMNWNKNRHYSYFYKDKAYVTIKDRVFI